MKKTALLKFKSILQDYSFVIVLVAATIGFITYLTYNHVYAKRFDQTIFEKKDFPKFEAWAQKYGEGAAYQILKAKYKNNEVDAHDFAHVVGLVAFEKSAIGGLALCDAAFNYGCHHGFIEGFLIKKGLDSVGEIETTCEGFGQLHAPSCLHGIGHALLINTSYNLEPALKDCERLKETSRIYCYDGVFMERVIGSMQNEKDRQLLTEDTLDKPCKEISAVYKSQCWRNQTTAWFQYFQNSSQEVLKMCTTIELEHQQICFESVGLFNVMKNGENLQGLTNDCKITEGLQNDSCLIGEIRELMFEGKNPQTAQALCQYTSAQNQQSCNYLFGQLLQEYQMRFQKI